MNAIRTADDAVQARLRRAIDIAAMPIGHEEVDWIVQSPRGREQIEHPVAIEILDTEPARKPGYVRADILRHIDESWEGRVRLRAQIRNQILPRHERRISAHRHVRDVEQPPGAEVVGKGLKDAAVYRDRCPRALLLRVM